MKCCPICKSESIRLWREGNIENVGVENFKITDYDYGKNWRLMECENCDFIFSDPFPPVEIKKIYEKVIDPEYIEEEEGRSGNFRSILKSLKKIKEAEGAFLDVGCATGIMMNLARNEGWDVYGVELSSWAIEEARKRYSLEISKGEFSNLELPENFFSVVAFVDILEHISNPREFLLKAWKTLKKDGLCVIVTPDIKSFTAKLMGKKWWHFRPAHIGFFSKKSLKYLLDSTGFEILKWKRYKWRFSLHYILSRIKFFRRISNSKLITPILKRVSLILPLMDSLEVYARKS